MKTPKQLGPVTSPSKNAPALVADERPAPSVYLDGAEFASLPEKGRITFEFVRRRVSVTQDGEGTNATVELALTCICDVKPSKMKEEKERKTEDVLDELLEEVQEEDEED